MRTRAFSRFLHTKYTRRRRESWSRRAGSLDGRPQIRAFVVGHTVSDKIELTRKIGDPERGWVRAATYTQLVRSGEKRLFNLKELGQPRLDGLDKAH